MYRAQWTNCIKFTKPSIYVNENECHGYTFPLKNPSNIQISPPLCFTRNKLLKNNRDTYFLNFAVSLWSIACWFSRKLDRPTCLILPDSIVRSVLCYFEIIFMCTADSQLAIDRVTSWQSKHCNVRKRGSQWLDILIRQCLLFTIFSPPSGQTIMSTCMRAG